MLMRTGQIVYKTARRIVITVVGGTLLIIGAIMLLTPGPGVLGIAAGLGILGLEYAWAKRWLAEVKRRSGQAINDINDEQSRLGRNYSRIKRFFRNLGRRIGRLFSRKRKQPEHGPAD